MKSKIYLIGLPGSGKTTLGKILASRLRVAFIDLDKEIEDREKKSISEIFSNHGEAYFRQVESDLLKEWSAKSGSFVMGTGGGAPCFHDGIEIINKTGISVFLDVSTEVLVKRLASKSDRPLLSNDNNEDLAAKIVELQQKRLPIYRKAIVTAEEPTVEKILDRLTPLI